MGKNKKIVLEVHSYILLFRIYRFIAFINYTLIYF